MPIIRRRLPEGIVTGRVTISRPITMPQNDVISGLQLVRNKIKGGAASKNPKIINSRANSS